MQRHNKTFLSGLAILLFLVLPVMFGFVVFSMLNSSNRYYNIAVLQSNAGFIQTSPHDIVDSDLLPRRKPKNDNIW